MKTLSRLLLTGAIFLCGCLSEEDLGFEIFSQTYDFNYATDGWESDFTDYPVNIDQYTDTLYSWVSEYPATPPGTNTRAFMLSCNNINGDVFMFMKKKIAGFEPNTNYTLVYEVELTSNALPGQGIVLKAGGSGMEPKKVIENNYYVLNIDKGLNNTSGENVVVVGDIAATPYQSDYNAVVRGNASSTAPLVVKSNSKGEIWLIIGTDSSYKGLTTVYYTKVSVVFSVSA